MSAPYALTSASCAVDSRLFAQIAFWRGARMSFVRQSDSDTPLSSEDESSSFNDGEHSRTVLPRFAAVV